MSIKDILESTTTSFLEEGMLLRLSTNMPSEGERVSVLKIVKAFDLADFGRCLLREMPEQNAEHWGGEWQAHDLEDYLLHYLLETGYAEWVPMVHVCLGDYYEPPRANAFAISQAPTQAERLNRGFAPPFQLEFQYPPSEPVTSGT